MKKRSQRIIYKEVENRPGLFRSCKWFTSERTGAQYLVEVNEETMTYKIINVNKQEVVKSSQKDGTRDVTNRAVILRQAKRALKQLGVVFEPEIKFVAETSLKTLEENRYVQPSKDSRATKNRTE